MSAQATMMTESATIDDVYATFGRAADGAQALEVDAGNVALATLAVFIKRRDENEDDNRLVRAVLDDLNSRTLGALLKIVKKITNLDVETDARLRDALKRRNYLMHHFFPTHNFAIYSAEGRTEMVGELAEIQLSLTIGQAILRALAEVLLKVAGVDECATAEQIKAFVRVGRRLDLR
jgi:hypothetical protein